MLMDDLQKVNYSHIDFELVQYQNKFLMHQSKILTVPKKKFKCAEERVSKTKRKYRINLRTCCIFAFLIFKPFTMYFHLFLNFFKGTVTFF